jgi:Sugar transferases involved in lipopolysaccharide synthesis
MKWRQRFAKRALDVVFAFGGCVVFFVPMVIIACLIKTSSRGPVLFSQKRVGQNGKLFIVLKFRTMRVGADAFGPITTVSDGRITGIGRILRTYKLDELPQLWNVLIGKMSFVGPRPDVAGYADRLTGENRKILELLPGITGPASFYFRDEERILAKAENPKECNDTILWPKKVELNLDYYNNWGFWKDIGYIIITVLPAFDRVFKLVPAKQKKAGKIGNN